MKLHNFYRSSASFRVRIALNLKDIDYEYVAVNLAQGESHSSAYEQLNPQGIVPTLEDNGRLIQQSLAICEYLEQTHPTPPLLPHDPAGRARVRAIALAVACEIHAVAGGRPQSLIATMFNATPDQRAEWSRHFIRLGFTAIERMLTEAKETGRFCHGDAPTMADAFLVPQVYNAELAKVDLAPFPSIRRICHECNQLDAFVRARPENQPDAA
jgi:maleylacetoacetate isomerase